MIEAVKAAKRYGTIVSYDLNYRTSLWRDIGGQEKARAVNREIAPYIDVMIGNEEDFTACLGFEVKGNDSQLKKLDPDGYRAMMDEVAAAYPNVQGDRHHAARCQDRHGQRLVGHGLGATARLSRPRIIRRWRFTTALAAATALPPASSTA